MKFSIPNGNGTKAEILNVDHGARHTFDTGPIFDSICGKEGHIHLKLVFLAEDR